VNSRWESKGSNGSQGVNRFAACTNAFSEYSRSKASLSIRDFKRNDTRPGG